MALLEGLDPQLGGMALGTAAFARTVAFPLVTLRRRTLNDKDDERTGAPYIPKPIQKAVALGVCVAANVAAGLMTGKPPIHAVVTAASGCIMAMLAYDAQKKRSDPI